MLQPVIHLTITQQPSAKFPARKKRLFFDFVESYEVESTWQNLTDTAEITLPKDVYVRDENNRLFQLEGINKNIGGGDSTTAPPLFLKGDKIVLNVGYIYEAADGTNQLKMSGREGLPDLFNGYIAEVISGKPFTLRCEDAMWKLKQTPVPNHTDTKGKNVTQLISNLLKGTDYSVSKKSTITVNQPLGYLKIDNNMSVAQLLDSLRKDLGLESYFRGNELRLGYPLYVEEEARNLNFAFGENIIGTDFTYQRKDDIVLSAVIKADYIAITGKKTRDGANKTKRETLELLVYYKNGNFSKIEKQKGESLPANLEGERKTFYYNWDSKPTIANLYDFGKQQLQKYCYTGFKGGFLTFGLPFVKHGDNAIIQNSSLPDQNGTYKIKGVRYYGSSNEGIRQDITLDYKPNA